jgi:hypothetical protein
MANEIRKHEIRRLRRLDHLLLTLTLTSICASSVARVTDHPRLVDMLAGAGITCAAGYACTAIKRANLEYAQAEEEKKERERREGITERENNSYIKQDNNYNK